MIRFADRYQEAAPAVMLSDNTQVPRATLAPDREPKPNRRQHSEPTNIHHIHRGCLAVRNQPPPLLPLTIPSVPGLELDQ